MPKSIEGFKIVFQAKVDGQEKIFGGEVSNSLKINKRIKESETKEDKGRAKKKANGYDYSFSISGVMSLNEEGENTGRLDSEGIIDLVLLDEEIEFSYGDHSSGKKIRTGKMLIQDYEQSSETSNFGQFSLNCIGTTDLKSKTIPAS